MSKTRDEFEKAFRSKFGLTLNDDPVALWVAKWMAERCASKCDRPRHNVAAIRIRRLAKELEER